MMRIDDDYWAFNFTEPTYQQFFVNVVSSIKRTCSELTTRDLYPSSLIDTVKTYGDISQTDILCFFALAVLWTVLRVSVVALVLKPILSFSKLRKREREKAPESAWKLIFYTSTWCYSINLLFFSNYDFFFNSPQTFYKWKAGQQVPLDIYIFYMVQLSFYLHSVYGTIYLDVWRKDSKIMLLHHLVTLLLVGFSYTFRFTNVGVLILFLHDVTDIILESTKLVLYHKTKGGAWEKVCDAISTVGFVLFGFSWFVFRLYWYPLKAMYAAGYTSIVVINGQPPFYLFFNALLWILLCMNIYWFKFIVVMAYHVVSGKVKEVEDTREYDDEVSSSTSEDEDYVKKSRATNGCARNSVGSKKAR